MITEEQYKAALLIIDAYKQQQRQARWKCMLCGRDRFDRKQPHKCVGGFRKRRIVWKEVQQQVA